MKDYKQLIKELPSKSVVFAFGRFNPPTIGHELLVKAVKKLAQQKKADHVIYASKSQDAKKNPLSVDKKVSYLKLMFKGTNFAAANDDVRTFIEAAKQLNKKYKNIVMVAGSDRVPEFKRLLNTYNGKEFNFDTIEVISAGERDPDADDASGMSASKMRAIATKGDYSEFKRGLPSTVREIDGKRLMNDIRDGMGLEPIKEQIILVKDELREHYFRGEIFNEGDIVESDGQRYTIVKRGSNHLLLKESTGKLVSKWIQDVKPTEEKEQMNEELTDKTIKSSDKIKVARVIASMLGIENAESSSNAENLVNTALRKMKSKTLNAESLMILDRMLNLATQVGINYDTNLKPSKLKEAVTQPNGTDKIDTKTSEPMNTNNKSPDIKVKKGMITFYNYSKAQKIKEQAELSKTDDKKDNESDQDYEHQISVTGVDKSEVGHTLVSAGGQDNLRRRKIKYQLGEQNGIEITKKIMKKGMTTYGKESGHENTAQHIATNPEHTGKQKEIAKSFISKMQGVSESVTPNDKASKEVAKANLAAKHAREKESLSDKHAREKASLSEDEQLQELSTDLLSRYKKKASDQASAADKAGDTKKADKRFSGIIKATNKQFANDAKGMAEAGNKPLEKSRFGTGDTRTPRDIKSQMSGASDEFVRSTADKTTGPFHSKVAKMQGKMAKSELRRREQGVAEEVEHLDELDYKTLQSYRQKAHTQTQHYKYAGGKDKPEAAAVLAKREPGMATATAKVIQKDKERIAAQPKREPQKTSLYKPLGGRDEKSGRSYSEELELDEAKKKPLLGVVATNKPFDPFFEDNEYDQTIDVATPDTKIETSEEDDIDDHEIEAMLGHLTDEEIMDEYDEDELALVDDETGEEIPKSKEEEAIDEQAIMEVLSRIERMKAKFRIRRTAAKRERATKIALKRYSNNATINKRSRRLAVKLMKQRLLRGRDVSKLSVGEKERIERTLETRKALIGRIATRLAPRVRKIEKARMSHSKYTQGSQSRVY